MCVDGCLPSLGLELVLGVNEGVGVWGKKGAPFLPQTPTPSLTPNTNSNPKDGKQPSTHTYLHTDPSFQVYVSKCLVRARDPNTLLLLVLNT